LEALVTSPEVPKPLRRRSDRQDWNDLEAVTELLPLRDEALHVASLGLRAVYPELRPDQVFALASTDLFVEKAQRVLTRRYRTLFTMGIVVIGLTLLILGLAVVLAMTQLRDPVDSEVLHSNQALALRIFQATAFTAFLLVAVKLLIALGRSFFHEALSLVERRHALRFGRLYVYLMKGEVEGEWLEGAFQWNKESRTSFLDMKPEVVAETLLHRIVEAFGKLPPETIRALSRSTPRRKRKSKADGSTDAQPGV